MPRRVNTLTDSEIRNARPGIKPRRLFDGGGLHLLINPDGSKYWRLKYLFNGKEKRIALGVYPKITLAEARNKAIKEPRTLKKGLIPQPNVRPQKMQDSRKLPIHSRPWR